MVALKPTEVACVFGGDGQTNSCSCVYSFNLLTGFSISSNGTYSGGICMTECRASIGDIIWGGSILYAFGALVATVIGGAIAYNLAPDLKEITKNLAGGLKKINF